MQAGGKVRCLAYDRLLLGRALADHVADDHQTGGDADARLELYRFDLDAADRFDRSQSRSHRPLGIVLMGLRVAVIDQDAVAHVPRYEAVGVRDNPRHRAVIRGDDIAQILGIELRRERGRSDQVAEHHRELTAFGERAGLRICSYGLRAQGSDRGEQFAAMADRDHTETDQVVSGELAQYLDIDIVLAERLFVLFESQVAQPGRDVHPCLAGFSISRLQRQLRRQDCPFVGPAQRRWGPDGGRDRD